MKNKERAAALVKGIGLTEAVTSVLGVSCFARAFSMGSDACLQTMLHVAYLFTFYGLFLLANLVYETSVGVLQTIESVQARLHVPIFIKALRRFSVDHCRFVLDLGIFGILTAYLVGKTIAGFMVTASAFRELNNKLGQRLDACPAQPGHQIGNPSGVLPLSTNLNGTINLFARDNIPLYIWLFSFRCTEVGYFKFASNPDQSGDAAH